MQDRTNRTVDGQTVKNRISPHGKTSPGSFSGVGKLFLDVWCFFNLLLSQACSSKFAK